MTRPLMRPATPVFIDHHVAQTVIVTAAVLTILAFAGLSLWNPQLVPYLLGAGVLLCLGAFAVPFTTALTVAWMLVAASSPEMWVADITSPALGTTMAGMVKLGGLALAGLCVLRTGLRLDLFNPGFAFAVMFVTGVGHGLLPGLTLGDSLRTLLGSAGPYAFSFARLTRGWCAAVIATTIWAAPFAVLFGAALAGAGLRDVLMVTEGSLRLAGSTHPAFLGAFAMTGMYAALLELWRGGRIVNLWLIALNGVILVASGARAPLFCAAVVIGFSFFFLRSEAFGPMRRVLPLLAGAMVVPIAVALASGRSSLRLLSVLSGEARSLSGRDIIWPFFQAAWDASPWFGWGVGAGKVVVDPDSLTAKLLGTTAAHNEYLRIGVDGGWFGLVLLIVVMALWCWHWTRVMPRIDKVIMRLVFLMFAVHSVTDNTLIASTASVLFAWISAVFARAALEREAAEAASG
ncbi:O-antigen ligase family protein [Rhodovastum atsumiense]|nr:O-antigen ligase family protein [Rhodovastum atsumiense]CAH2604433.1 O-antigen ligase family protein [Rhodovastum atsumiense]